MVLARTVDKKIVASRKKFKKELKKVKSKSNKQSVEIAKLKAEMEKLKKKKTKSGHISEYNFFIKKQILSGLTFSQAVRQWNKYKSLQAKNKRRPSAYNQFIGSQMRLGKTFLAAVALWKLAKAGKLGKKGKTRTVTKTVVKRIKSKPKIKYRTRTKTVVKRVRSRPKVVVRKVRSRPILKTKKITRVLRSPGTNFSALKTLIESSHTSTSEIKSALNPDDEEIAFKIVQTYFKEIARFGLKRQLSLDEIINAYFYALARVKRENIEMSEVASAVKKAGIRK
jgi:hypothetical protein